MKKHAEQRGRFVDLFDGAKAKFKTPEQATNFLKLIAAGYAQTDRLLVIPRPNMPRHTAFLFSVRASEEYMLVHQQGDDAFLIRLTADELRRLDPGVFAEAQKLSGAPEEAPSERSVPPEANKPVHQDANPKRAARGLQFIATLKDNTITFSPASFPTPSEKAGQVTLTKIASAVLGTQIDHRQIPDEIPDLVFIHTPTPHYVVLMPEPTEGLMLGIGSWSALESDEPEAAAELQRMIQTAMTGGKQH
ncbi:MAG: hypothetical protein Q4D91_12990 [Lautropia sp.]|nr:hypothetical protein [Lautropia sp.]